MAFDKDKPAGGDTFAVSDDNIRANNAALETAIGTEHRFATGGNQSGRHTFERDTTTNLSAVSDVSAGWLALSTDERSGFEVLMTYDGSNLVPVDVDPVDGSSNPTLPRVNSQSKFTTSQFAAWEEITPAAGTPDTLAVDLTGSPMKWATLVGDTILSNPTGPIASHGTVVSFDIVQGGTAYTLTFGTSYKAPGSVVQVGGANTRTLLTLQVMPTGIVLVSSIPDWNQAIT